jgi:hypothetical protein
MARSKSNKKPITPEPPPETSSIRWRPEDWQMIAQLQKETGIESVSELLRLALRALKKQLG